MGARALLSHSALGRLAALACPAFLFALAACSGRSESAPPEQPADDAAVTAPGDAGVGARDGASAPEAAAADAPADATDAHDLDAGAEAEAAPDGACAPFGAPGECMDVTACAALGDHTSYPGYCPGPSSIECCIVTPSTANNPPVPTGWVLMQQSAVTAAMTTWAVDILDDPTTYPMFSTTTKTFGTQEVLARVEWHPPDFQNGVIHRGVTLYVPQ